MAYKLDPTCPPGGELIRVVCGRLIQAVETAGNKRRPLKERIHTVRTSCKKAQAGLKLLRCEDEKRARRGNRIIGDAARELSVLRDADAILDSFDAALKHYAVPAQKFRAIRAVLLAHRRNVTPVRTELERQFRAVALRLRKVAKRLDGWEPAVGFDAVAAGFGQTYRRARRALRAIQDRPTAKGFHAWWKAAKAYFYQCRLLREAWSRAMKELSDELRQLSARLGDEHDLTVLRDRLRRLERKGKLEMDDDTRAAIFGLLATRRDELRAEVIPLGERLFADKPRAVAARVTRWWAVAQEGPPPAIVA